MAIGAAVDNAAETSGDLNKEAWDKYNSLRTAVLKEHAASGTHSGWTDVRAYDVAPSETGVNNQTYLTAVITAITAGDVILIPPGSYTVVGNWTISKACTIYGYGATLNFSTDAINQGIKVSASDVKIYGLKITGPQYAASNTTQHGVWAYGADASNYISGLRVIDCIISNWGRNAIYGEFLDDFIIDKNDIDNCYYSGMLLLSCQNAQVSKNNIYNIIGTPAAYGIAISRHNGTYATYPQSENIMVSGNYIEEVTNWEALDTHAGIQISFIGNTSVDCLHALLIGGDGNTRASGFCVAKGNTFRIDDLATVSWGIACTGQNGGTKSTNCIISGNTIEGYGADDAGSGAIYIRDTANWIIKGNSIVNSARAAIVMKQNNDNILITGNNIKTLTGTAPAGISSYSLLNGGMISNNVIDVGADIGIQQEADVANTLSLVNNHITTSGSEYGGYTARFTRIMELHDTISAAQWGMLGAGVEWTAWTPTLTGGADLSGYDAARYFRIGDICFFAFQASNKNVTTAGVIQITLPFTAANTDIVYIPSASVDDGATETGAPYVAIVYNTNYIQVYKTVAGGTWAGTETGVKVRLTGFFEIA